MPKVTGRSILLCGIGGDSHSVGLNILRQALMLNGYRVLYLGTQNNLEEIFPLAPHCNAVMISNMDGHAARYLRDFPILLQQYKTADVKWYLGGNLTIGDAIGHEEHFMAMGFHRVFVKFVDIRTVLQVLEQDLHNAKPVGEIATLWDRINPKLQTLSGAVSDDILPPDTFETERKEVLSHWRTGSSAKILEENAEFLVSQPALARLQAKTRDGKHRILVQPRSGVATLDGQINLFKAFRSHGADVLSYQVDSLTRNNNYAAAEEEIRESAMAGVSTINGFPVINHGVSGLRKVSKTIQVPLQTRHSTRDPRLLAEITYAGGATAFEGGAICYNIPYYKNYPLSDSIRAWSYVDRLTGLYYEKFGLVLDREFFGTLTGTLIPPCIAIVTNLVEAILAARQGVKCVSLGYAEQGHRIQDAAAIKVMAEVTTRYLGNLGFSDVQVYTVFYQYMAAFPQLPDQAEDLIRQSAVTATLSGATRMLVKTPVEAFKIPTMADNLHGISLTLSGIEAARKLQLDTERINAEATVIEHEVDSIFESVLMSGRGSLTQGLIEAFKRGYIDIPFAPSIYNSGRVITARDTEGAVRFLDPGNLQLAKEEKEFHEHLIQERRRSEGLLNKGQDYLIVERDVLRVPRGQFDRWPLYQ